MSTELTTTSYAILGLLAVRSWTTYELAQQMDRALGRFWPRARSKLYEEPKKLVAHGLAKATTESVGRRPRTVYAITRKGRRALAAWVPEESDGPQLEFEALVKVFFAEHGTRDDLLATLERVRAWCLDQEVTTADIPRAYVEGRGAFPERLPWILLSGEFLGRFTRMVDEWAEWATAIVATWPDDVRDAAPDLDTLARMNARADAAVSRAAPARTSSPAASGSDARRTRPRRRPSA